MTKNIEQLLGRGTKSPLANIDSLSNAFPIPPVFTDFERQALSVALEEFIY